MDNFKNESKINAFVNTLRIIAKDDEFGKKEVIIPRGTNQTIFFEGEHSLGELLYYLADMLEE